MYFDFSRLSARDAYKLMAGSVVPRPIALITSLDEQGVVNAAPYSFFNLVGGDPILVAVGISEGDSGKDTGRNIAALGEFVVNLVDFSMADAMNICAINFPAGQSETEIARLETAPASLVKVPRLLASPVSLECREHTTLRIGNNRVVIGEVVGAWIKDEFVDGRNFYVDTVALDLIGRMGGAGGYTKTQQPFEIARVSYDEWCSARSEV